MIYRKAVLIFLITVIGSVLVSAGEWFGFNTENSGLSSNQVRSIYITNDGIKWFGTDKGMTSFNGSEWKTISDDTYPNSYNIRDIAFEQLNGNPALWAATAGGATFFPITGNEVASPVFYTPENSGIASANASSVCVDVFNVRWIGTGEGVSGLFGTEWSTFTTDNHLSSNVVTCIAADKDSFKYVGTLGGGVSRLIWNGVDAVSSASPYDYSWTGLLSRDDNIFAIYVLENGDQWFGTDTGCAFHDTTDTKAGWTAYTTEDGLVHDFVQAIAQDLPGNMWFGTKGGVSVWHDNRFTNFTTADGLADNNVNDIAVDIDGSIWFATENGVSHLTGVVSSIITEKPAASVSGYQLLSNYPNPFNPETTISYHITFPAHVRLDIYNMRGQLVDRLVDARHSPGVYEINWNSVSRNNLPINTGVYFARIVISDNDQYIADSHKILYIK
ncbi:T9SS type A sorting domain-containing protein [candidate division KSB1 bacterium]|nr:T9SS type A sorting domain-containing protein [candidate division KSB1 bacterium]